MLQHRCEVCESYRPGADLRAHRNLVELYFDKHLVQMCVGHARIAQNSGVESLAGLRELYAENEGRRSFVPRRSKVEVTLFRGLPRSPGRRATDA